jgi:hypothetical protein
MWLITLVRPLLLGYLPDRRLLEQADASPSRLLELFIISAACGLIG